MNGVETTPSEMTVVEITEPGGPEVLKAARRATPAPSAGEVLIKVAAAGVNGPDLMQRKGLYPPPPGASDLPGLELSGSVVAVGADVASPSIGDSVCALVTGGAYAEYCVASAALCLPIPDGVSRADAGGVPETFFTVWTNLVDTGRLEAGGKFLVHGGSSGIGLTAIQIAKALGAEVFTTARSDEKCAACREIGADVAINYRDKDFVEVIKQRTEGRGVDLVLDMVGGDYFPRNIACLARGGTLISIGFARGPKAEVNFAQVMVKRLTLTGSTLRPRSVEEKAGIAKSLRERVWPLFADGKARVIVDSTFPLVDAAKAHARMESSDHIGKVILTV